MQINDFWRCYQSADNQWFEFYWHVFGTENGPERAQTDLQKRHCCDAAVAFSAFKCGSFASSKGPKENNHRFSRWPEAGFPFRMRSFGECVFVSIIHCNPLSCRDSFHRFWLVWPIHILISPVQYLPFLIGPIKISSSLNDLAEGQISPHVRNAKSP